MKSEAILVYSIIVIARDAGNSLEAHSLQISWLIQMILAG